MPSQPRISANPADGLEEYLLNMTRRRFFGSVATSIGAGIGVMIYRGIVQSRIKQLESDARLQLEAVRSEQKAPIQFTRSDGIPLARSRCSSRSL